MYGLNFECLEMPTPGNILKLCKHTASYLYIQYPCAINEVRRGNHHENYPFWNAKEMSALYRLYIVLTITPLKGMKH